MSDRWLRLLVPVRWGAKEARLDVHERGQFAEPGTTITLKNLPARRGETGPNAPVIRPRGHTFHLTPEARRQLIELLTEQERQEQ